MNHCEKCGTNKYLQIHHIHYRTIGKEANSDLKVLCNRCHRKLHKRRGR